MQTDSQLYGEFRLKWLMKTSEGYPTICRTGRLGNAFLVERFISRWRPAIFIGPRYRSGSLSQGGIIRIFDTTDLSENPIKPKSCPLLDQTLSIPPNSTLDIDENLSLRLIFD